MAKRPSEDIPIGDDEWIPFIALDGRHKDAADIDEWLQPLLPLFDRLEIHCVAGCCGLPAFDFGAEAVTAAAASLDRAHLLLALQAAAAGIAQLPQGVVLSRRLNNYVDKTTFLQLLRHLSVSLASPLPDATARRG